MDRVGSVSRSYGNGSISALGRGKSAGRTSQVDPRQLAMRQNRQNASAGDAFSKEASPRRGAEERPGHKNTDERQNMPESAALAKEIARLRSEGQDGRIGADTESRPGVSGERNAAKKATDRQAGQEAGRLSAAARRSQEQYAAWKSAQEWLERQREAQEKKERKPGLVSQLQAQADAMKKALDPKRKRNLYDATMDLTLIEQIEKEPALKAMQSRLAFKIRSVKSSGAEASEIRRAVAKLNKVIGKVKAKIKGLRKEEQLEKKRKKAAEARRKAKEEAVRRELEMRKKIRKAKERNDIEESKMGLGCNYGGLASDAVSVSFAAGVPVSIEESLGAAASSDVGAAMDVAVAEMGAAVAADAGGAVDVSL